MFPHHAEAIEKVTAHFRADPSVQTLLLTGSIAHGLENADSDVDIMIILPDDDAEASRNSIGAITSRTFFSRELAPYPGGYVDGKYGTLRFIRAVAERGSEPARFAFADARVLFSRLDAAGTADLVAVLRAAAAYPAATKGERTARFAAQLDAWRWYCLEAIRKGDDYLLRAAVSKLQLFGGRLVLTENEVLYPFHKWFVRVLAGVERKPEGLMEAFEAVGREPTKENVDRFYKIVKEWREWGEHPDRWPAQFMLDSELNWVDGQTPVDDL